ncbi:zinc finger protein 229 isoform X1 [Corythoichthys intestinalis]|uniref:zinc finger protein 229 isoform X1 n=1 Tax=Corythoichthys intestinalis TaxID=161448 RepID=UPI0025A54184|nr:zinc finger protein 229 isoform X1 [Corythoichthys intestinalis]
MLDDFGFRFYRCRSLEKTDKMSADAVNIQAQVESVLGALVKIATMELTKLFESRYRSVATSQEVGRADNDSQDTFSSEERTRSIGVQVDEHVNTPLGFSYGGCSKEYTKEQGVLGCLSVLLTGDKPHDKQAETGDGAELSIFEQTGASLDDQKCGPRHSPPAKQKPPSVQPDPSEDVSISCPLTQKPESSTSQPHSSETPVKAEPNQACASTAKGRAYSPSLCDGAVNPVPAGIQEHPPLPNGKTTHLRKCSLPDQKLGGACVVQLVDVRTAAEMEAKIQQRSGNGKARLPLPKDLRRHQGVHTGHRLCCFAPPEDGIWRLQKVISHSHNGYACAICGKMFKRRKILRRHERFHSGEKPYSCSQCSKTFALRKSLRHHVRFHTGERPHKCTHCDKSFRLRENLKTHLRFHTGEKPYRCHSCGKMFRILGNLDRHQLNPCGFFVPSFRTVAGL